jgi:hypothetical protein
MKSSTPDKAEKKDAGLSTRASAKAAGLRAHVTKLPLKGAKSPAPRLVTSKPAVSPQPTPRISHAKKPVFMRGGVVYPIPSRKILDSLRKGYPNGDAIKAFREAINLNVREFAFFIGVDPATVFRWETQRTGKLQLGSLSKVMKLVNNVAAGKPVKIPTVARFFF